MIIGSVLRFLLFFDAGIESWLNKLVEEGSDHEKSPEQNVYHEQPQISLIVYPVHDVINDKSRYFDPKEVYCRVKSTNEEY